MALEFKDYYRILGVPRTASQEEIKRQYRELARQHHPDVAKHTPGSEEKFKDINEAYEVLRDPEKRKRYDMMGFTWDGAADFGSPFPGTRRRSRSRAGEENHDAGDADFSEFFEAFFRGGSAPPPPPPRSHTGTSRRSRGPTKGKDVEASLVVTLEEVLHGSVRKVTLRKPASRSEVHGTTTYEVKIPAGVQEGQRIRLAGQGGAGQVGGPNGDVLLRISFHPHPTFTVDGSDLTVEVKLSPWEAVLGAKLEIPSLDGRTTLRVPPGIHADNRLRLRGLGLPKGDGTRGDLYAKIHIDIPQVISPEEHALWEQLSREANEGEGQGRTHKRS